MITKEQFIKDYYKSRENSDYVVKYNFSLLPDIIPTQQTKVTVICLEEFVDGIVGECQTTYAVLVKDRSDVRGYTRRKNQRWTTEEFVKRVQAIPGNEVWDLSETVYIDKKHKIKVRCKRCGKTVEIWPGKLIDSDKFVNRRFFGCKECVYKDVLEERRQEAEKKFLSDCKEKFGNAFDYSKVKYVNNSTPVEIKCNHCGNWFHQAPRDHIKSNAGMCPRCIQIMLGQGRAKTLEEFIRQAEEVHGKGKYDYSEVVYVNKLTPVKIKKQDGTVFEIKPNIFLLGSDDRSGFGKSDLEIKITDWLGSHGISFEREIELKDVQSDVRSIIRVDFVLDGGKTIIEANGKQHYSLGSMLKLHNISHNKEEGIKIYKNQIQRDRDLKKYCEENGIRLIIIPYTHYSYSRIDSDLTQILIEGKNPDEVIKQPEIEKI